MKSALLMALIAFVYVTPALAQDRIELWADQNMSTCSITEAASPPIVQVHVFITGSMSATGVRFTAPKPACWVGATFVGDELEPAVSIGHSQGDWSIAWGFCATTPKYLGVINYLTSGQALPCCKVDALPAMQFAFTDCAFVEHELGESKSIMVNPDASCGCQSGITTAAETTSWGRVKALYR
jgi:hypothetical protein